ncbi:MAG: hypothetical protein P9L89_05350 [Candidatus Celaenobacter polaris]|nr:hypothetical protein [Candidatus Celaenobacter polaris]
MKNIIKFFTKWILKIIIVIIFILTFFLIPRFFHTNPNFLSKQLLYYLYSALIQANAAIFSISGVFYIFQMQNLRNARESSIQELRMLDRYRRNSDRKVTEYLNTPLQQRISEIKDPNNGIFNITKSKINNYEGLIIKNKSKIFLPLIFMTFSIFVEIISLVLTNQMYNSSKLVTYYICFFNIIIELSLIIIVSGFIIHLLNDKYLDFKHFN